MPLLVRGGGGGKNTKDATAVPGDVASGKTFYGKNGKEIGTANVPKEIIFSIKDGEEFSKVQKQLSSAKLIRVQNGTTNGGEEDRMNIGNVQDSSYIMLRLYSTLSLGFYPKVFKSLSLDLTDFIIELTDAKNTAKAFVVPSMRNFPNGIYVCQLLFKNVFTQFTRGYAYVYFKLANKRITEIGIVGEEDTQTYTQRFDMGSSGNELLFKIRGYE